MFASVFSYCDRAMNFSASSILLALISTSIIFCGCSKKEEPLKVVTIDKIQERNGIHYEVNQTTPFTGLSQEFYPNGQKKEEINFKDGENHGLLTQWYENGVEKD